MDIINTRWFEIEQLSKVRPFGIFLLYFTILLLEVQPQDISRYLFKIFQFSPSLFWLSGFGVLKICSLFIFIYATGFSIVGKKNSNRQDWRQIAKLNFTTEVHFSLFCRGNLNRDWSWISRNCQNPENPVKSCGQLGHSHALCGTSV